MGKRDETDVAEQRERLYWQEQTAIALDPVRRYQRSLDILAEQRWDEQQRERREKRWLDPFGYGHWGPTMPDVD